MNPTTKIRGNHIVYDTIYLLFNNAFHLIFIKSSTHYFPKIATLVILKSLFCHREYTVVVGFGILLCIFGLLFICHAV